MMHFQIGLKIASASGDGVLTLDVVREKLNHWHEKNKTKRKKQEKERGREREKRKHWELMISNISKGAVSVVVWSQT